MSYKFIASAGVVATAAASMALRTMASAAGTAAAAAHDAASAIPQSDKSVFLWWQVLTQGDARVLLTPSWWISYISAEFDAEPAHVIVEVLCFVTIALLILRKPAPMAPEKLSKKEEEELIAEWKPEPLCPVYQPAAKTRFIVESATGRTVVANGGNRYVNFAANNFLGLADRPETKAACRATIEKYGVGSCGPRGFYGTFDLHLEIESHIAKFMQADECILYSDAIACVSSVIPAFSKKGDTLVIDDSVNFGIQQGALLSRSTIYYFKHNDMNDLENVLQTIAKKEAASHHRKSGVPTHRKFIVVEGVSSVYGDVCPLAKVLELKKKYHYRLIMDDSLGFGVLGATGRGTMEHAHCGMQTAKSSDKPGVDILCASMDGALASVGGFCVGSHQVVDHQRLSGAGYCFSASSPPYTSTASICSMQVLASEGSELCASLRKKASRVRKSLGSGHRALVVLGGDSSIESPVIHLAFKNGGADSQKSDRAKFEDMLDILREEHGMIVSVPEFIPADRVGATVKSTLRIVINEQHTEQDLEKLIKSVTNAANKVL